MALKLILFTLSWSLTLGQRPLGTYDINIYNMSVSGMSSGASMATQMHVAYSGKMKGVGMFAGSPYWCARGSLTTALNACMVLPNNINIPAILSQTQNYVNNGDIDNTNNIQNHKVFIWHGNRDSTVLPGVMPRVEEFYENFVDADNVMTIGDIPAGHTMPTSHYGAACGVESSPWINNCGFSGAYEMLNFIYGGNLIEPTYGPTPPGDFYIFDQREFFNFNPSISSMDTEGYVYVPTGCMNPKREEKSCEVAGGDRKDCGSPDISPSQCLTFGCCYDESLPNVPWCFLADEPQQPDECKLHIVFHGCLQGKYRLGDEYARHTGYNEVGEANNIIMLYPQAVSSLGTNPNGCWDWWGYNTPNVYATQIGHQVLATCRMIEKITGGTGVACPDPSLDDNPRFPNHPTNYPTTSK